MGHISDLMTRLLSRRRRPLPECVLLPGQEPRVRDGHDSGAFVELGSLTKVLTGTALVRMAGAGLLEVDAPVERVLPQAPASGISLRHLMEHTSGLPRLPPGLSGPRSDPYRDFTPAALDQLLERLDRLGGRQPGQEEYSNFGYAVLGAALAAAAGTPYPELVREHVLEPLGLADEVTAAPPAGRTLRARTRTGAERTPWTMDGAILPAGGMWGTPRALATLVRALLVEQVLGDPAPSWQTAGRLRWHNGATRDASAFAGAFPDTGEWVVVHRLGGAPADTDRRGVGLLSAAGQPAAG
ncbi:serine hydrolase domain-containing protein [Streptomyces qinglanensis]|uniref:serine hydrolase domain-containing protein n=1 Tax=Streptomyces qinglanensis TaxID=943816 RepID=UPI001EF8E099|nr:serine hydrolase domain-containing protein [Streptomyces qinglanensis]